MCQLSLANGDNCVSKHERGAVITRLGILGDTYIERWRFSRNCVGR